MIHQATLLTATLLLVGTVGHARQIGSPRPLGNLTSLTSDWDSAGSGSFGDSLAGDFDGDGILDVATRRGADLEVLLAPGSLGVLFSGFSSPTGFTVVHDDGLGRDVLIVAEGAGLKRYELDPSSQGWNATALAASSGWNGATQLATRPLSGLPDQILGVMSNGLTVRALTNLGSGYVEEVNPVTTASQAIRDLQAFDMDGDGVAELALMHTGSVGIYAATGAPGAESWSPFSNRAYSGALSIDIARGAQATGGKEWIVWAFTDMSDGNQYTVVLDDGAPMGPALVGALQIVRIETGDWDGDGSDDLALSWRAEQRLGVLPNQGTTRASFPASGLERIDLTGTPAAPFTGNEAQPVLADLDNDGDAEACLSVLGAGLLHMELGEVVDATAWMPTLYLPNSSTPADVVDLFAGQMGGLDTFFDLQAPDEWLVDGSGNQVPLTLEVDVWNLPSAGGALMWKKRVTESGLTPPSHPVQVVFNIDEGSTPFDSFYFWRARYVLRDANGLVTYSTPSQLVGFHAAGDPTQTTAGADADDFLIGLGGVAPVEVKTDTATGSGPYTRIGSALTLPTLVIDVEPPPV